MKEKVQAIELEILMYYYIQYTFFKNTSSNLKVYVDGSLIRNCCVSQ